MNISDEARAASNRIGGVCIIVNENREAGVHYHSTKPTKPTDVVRILAEGLAGYYRLIDTVLQGVYPEDEEARVLAVVAIAETARVASDEGWDQDSIVRKAPK